MVEQVFREHVHRYLKTMRQNMYNLLILYYYLFMLCVEDIKDYLEFCYFCKRGLVMSKI